jgi:hypothetical protein
MRVFVFEVVKEAAREQRDEDQREPVRLLVFEAIVASDVSLRGRKEDDAEDSGCSWQEPERPLISCATQMCPVKSPTSD